MLVISILSSESTCATFYTQSLYKAQACIRHFIFKKYILFGEFLSHPSCWSTTMLPKNCKNDEPVPLFRIKNSLFKFIIKISAFTSTHTNAHFVSNHKSFKKNCLFPLLFPTLQWGLSNLIRCSVHLMISLCWKSMVPDWKYART